MRSAEKRIAVKTIGTPNLSNTPNPIKKIATNKPCLKLDDKWVVRTSPL